MGKTVWRDVRKSRVVTNESFPSRQDYLDYFSIPDSPGEIAPELVISAQRDWHMRGQNGCIFAMHAAHLLTETEWSRAVHVRLPTPTEVATELQTAIDHPTNQLHSMLFPAITSIDMLPDLVDTMQQAGCVLYEDTQDDVAILRLRLQLGEVESWVLGFAPFEELPTTRIAPFTELVFRTKTKQKVIHEMLNNDPSQAHVADIDLGFQSNVLERLVKKSSSRTARLLGGEACRVMQHGAKAKTTFGVPLKKHRWQKMRRE